MHVNCSVLEHPTWFYRNVTLVFNMSSFDSQNAKQNDKNKIDTATRSLSWTLTVEVFGNVIHLTENRENNQTSLYSFFFLALTKQSAYVLCCLTRV